MVAQAKVASLKETISVNAFTSIPRAFLKSIGMPSVSINNVLKIRVNYLYHASFWNLGLCVLGEMIYFVRGFLGIADNLSFLDMTNLILCIGFIMMCYAKTFAILFQSEHINSLLTDLQALYPTTLEEQQTYRVKKYYVQSRRVMQMYAHIQMFMIWCFNLFPIAETLMLYASDDVWDVVFPYLIWYPFNPYPRGLFECLYASQFWAAYVSAAGILAVDMLLCGIVTQICMQFDDLKRKFLNLTPTGNFYEDMPLLKAYIQKHSEIVRLSVDLNSIFSITILFNFVSSAIIICMMAFLSIFSDRITQIIKYTFTLITCVLQIFIMGWLGDKFIESSTDIANGVYNSHWIEGDKRFQKFLIPIIQRSQRPVTLTAYKFTAASLISVANVLSTSWKFLTLLKTVYIQL